MPALSALLLSALPVLAQTTPPDFELGVAALQAKDPVAARAAFDRCVGATPAGAPEQVACQWEAGWAAWLQGDWAGVVDYWEAVRASDPTHDGLDKYLRQAKDQLSLADLVAKGRAAAPDSFATTAPEGATVRFRSVGDMMIGTDFPEGKLPPEGGAQSFQAVQDWLVDADISFGNLEGPLCDGGKTDKCKPDAAPGSCYAFRTPSAYGQWFQQAGFDVVSTANNHSGDFGEVCRTQTEAVLDRLGIAHTGRPGDIAHLEANGLKVAVIGFHTNRACHYVNDHDTAVALVKALSSEHDIVVVSFHGGAEGSKAIHVPDGEERFYGENRGDLRRFTHKVIDAGADLVLGHGPHVPRGMELYKGRLIAYSMGNFATYGRFNISGNQGLGMVLETTLDREGKLVQGRILSTRQEGQGVPVKDPSGATADLVRLLSAEDFPDHGVAIAKDGSIAPR